MFRFYIYLRFYLQLRIGLIFVKSSGTLDDKSFYHVELLMIIRTATYQTEAESRMDFCLACDDRSCVRCCRLTRLKANSVLLRARYDEWIKSM